MKQKQDDRILLLLPFGLVVLWVKDFFESLQLVDRYLWGGTAVLVFGSALIWFVYRKLPSTKARKKRIDQIREIPEEMLLQSQASVKMGAEVDLKATLFLPDSIRKRHVHILGSTGSGKTESVVLNFLGQDVARGLGTIILDAKGDQSFLEYLNKCVPRERLLIFDLSNENSTAYNPLELGNPLEAAQRLFSSLTWSEEYYRSKALSCLQVIFEKHFANHRKNPTLVQISEHLASPKSYAAFVCPKDHPQNLAQVEFQELAGLRDQIRSLTLGHLSKILSPSGEEKVLLEKAFEGNVIYFRLQSLVSPQIVAVVGKLIINQINYMAGTAHREEVKEHTKQRKLVPVYFDEFASFACDEFADLISKARSAGFALHFAHQSIGDLTEISPGFLNRITDNSATKIVMRINDPDSADFFARSFGTRLYQKTTQRITNTKEIDDAEIVGEGTSREAHQFRASPDLFKTLPTGAGAVLVAHGRPTPHGASSVFTIQFPQLKGGEEVKA